MREAIGIGLFVTAALLGAVGLGYQLGCYAMAEEALRYKHHWLEAEESLRQHWQHSIQARQEEAK